MKAWNRKKEEQLKRLRQKHIQSAFYETAGPSEGEELIGIKKRPDDLGIDNTASRVRALLAVHHLRRSPIEKKADKRYGRSSRTKPDRHNASLPYLKNEGRGRSQNRMTQSLTLQRNTSFPHKQPEQWLRNKVI